MGDTEGCCGSSWVALWVVGVGSDCWRAGGALEEGVDRVLAGDALKSIDVGDDEVPLRIPRTSLLAESTPQLAQRVFSLEERQRLQTQLFSTGLSGIVPELHDAGFSSCCKCLSCENCAESSPVRRSRVGGS